MSCLLQDEGVDYKGGKGQGEGPRRGREKGLGIWCRVEWERLSGGEETSMVRSE